MTADRARITVFDTTLRDGEHPPGCSMNASRKSCAWLTRLHRLGVDVIEAGFPIASDGDFESVKAIASVSAVPSSRASPGPAAPISNAPGSPPARRPPAHPLVPRHLLPRHSSAIHKLRITRDECVAQARDSIRFAKSLCHDIELFSPKTPPALHPDFLPLARSRRRSLAPPR